MDLRQSASPTVGTARRTLLKVAGVAAAAGFAEGTFLVSPALAAPSTVSTKIVLSLTAWAYAGEPLDLGAKLLYDVTAPFRAAHPGVDVRILPSLAGATGVVVASILGGQPPDVIQDWDAGLWEYLNSGLVLPLDSYIRRDNINLSVFDKGQLDVYRNVQGHLIALPAQTDPAAIAVNLGTLDQLGIAYPPDNWTYLEAEKLWRGVATTVNGKRRYGGEIYRSSTAMPDAFYLMGFGGSYVDPSNPTRCVADAAGSVAGLEWAANLLLDNVCTWRGGGLRGGTVVTRTTGSWAIPPEAAGWRSLKWRYYPMPTWPVRPATFCTTNFWAIPANVKRPDLAWELLKWVALSPAWQRGMMKVFLTVPSVQTLWSEWENTVYAVAPPLRDKNIEAFKSAVVSGAAYPTGPFAYSTSQAYAILAKWWNKVMSRSVSVRAAMTEATKQVNALEALGSKAEAATARQQAAFEAFAAHATANAGKALTTPAPVNSDAGTPAKEDPGLVRAAGTQGPYTLTAAGGGYLGTTDGGTFLCGPTTSTEGTFTCRLTRIAAVKASTIANGAKIGLMARSSKSSGAAAAFLEVAVGRGVHFETRPIPGVGTNDQRPTASTAATGLIGSSVILADNAKPAANYLVKPVWLRLVRTGVTWTASTSLDGQAWTQAGTSVLLEAEGAWLGLFATSHDSGHYIQATFDHLSGLPPLGPALQIGTA